MLPAETHGACYNDQQEPQKIYMCHWFNCDEKLQAILKHIFNIACNFLAQSCKSKNTFYAHLMILIAEIPTFLQLLLPQAQTDTKQAGQTIIFCRLNHSDSLFWCTHIFPFLFPWAPYQLHTVRYIGGYLRHLFTFLKINHISGIALLK